MHEYVFKYGVVGSEYKLYCESDEEAIEQVKRFFSCIISFTPESLKELEISFHRVDYTEIDLTQ